MSRSLFTPKYTGKHCTKRAWRDPDTLTSGLGNATRLHVRDASHVGHLLSSSMLPFSMVSGCQGVRTRIARGNIGVEGLRSRRWLRSGDHHDVMRAFLKQPRRADADLAVSRLFHPRIAPPRNDCSRPAQKAIFTCAGFNRSEVALTLSVRVKTYADIDAH